MSQVLSMELNLYWTRNIPLRDESTDFASQIFRLHPDIWLRRLTLAQLSLARFLALIPRLHGNHTNWRGQVHTTLAAHSHFMPLQLLKHITQSSRHEGNIAGKLHVCWQDP